MLKKSKKSEKSVDFILGICYITYALTKKPNKRLRKSAKKSKKVVDKTLRKWYISFTRCKRKQRRNDL